MSALDNALCAISAAAPAGVDRVIETGAARIMSMPFPEDWIRLTLELPMGIVGETRPEWLLEICRDRIRVMRQLGEKQHYAYSSARMIGLLQAELALARAVDFGSWAGARREHPKSRQIAAE